MNTVTSIHQSHLRRNRRMYRVEGWAKIISRVSLKHQQLRSENFLCAWPLRVMVFHLKEQCRKVGGKKSLLFVRIFHWCKVLHIPNHLIFGFSPFRNVSAKR
jgi:hypothetical protein